jgi:hypothetical protein
VCSRVWLSGSETLSWRAALVSVRTATRLALSNCSVPEIPAITGHTIATVEQILDAHYLGGRVELAESAIKKLSAVFGSAQKSEGFSVRERSTPQGTE